MKLIGVENKKGTFKNEAGAEVAYNNTYIHCTYENENTIGVGTKSYKLSRDCQVEGGARLSELIGKEVILSTQSSQYGTTVNFIFPRE